ncbi:hypothetical protein [Natronocalculus amylovorans]|uniref:Uncharacterized protein n=1 Tax=Natronocalculus amylovorans TaxID=2917812 RepID=A0AAE3K8Y8_9EURY|nr:hypothetical protein [Natronocalculus amylovorans]MCL9817000.1 hypothetical protein [Natronocalculus amylovorans]
MNLKVASIVLAVLAAMILLTGTFGFTSVTADRGLQVSVADNDHAKVGIEKLGGEASAGDTIELLNITNNWADGMIISDVTVESLDGDDISDTNLDVGEDAVISAACTLGAGTTEDVVVTFTASVDGAQTTITRTVEVQCQEESADSTIIDVSFFGGGQQDVNLTAPATANENVTVWSRTGNGVFSKNTTTDLSEKNNKKIGVDSKQGQVFAIYFESFDVTYLKNGDTDRGCEIDGFVDFEDGDVSQECSDY